MNSTTFALGWSGVLDKSCQNRKVIPETSFSPTKRLKKRCMFGDNFQLKQWFPNCTLWYNISMKMSLKKRSHDQATLGTQCNMYPYEPFMVHVHSEMILKVYRKENCNFKSTRPHLTFMYGKVFLMCHYEYWTEDQSQWISLGSVGSCRHRSLCAVGVYIFKQTRLQCTRHYGSVSLPV